MRLESIVNKRRTSNKLLMLQALKLVKKESLKKHCAEATRRWNLPTLDEAIDEDPIDKNKLKVVSQ